MCLTWTVLFQAKQFIHSPIHAKLTQDILTLPSLCVLTGQIDSALVLTLCQKGVGASQMALVGKNRLPVQVTQRHLASIPAREDPLEEGVATHSNILAWRIPVDRGAWWATVHGVTKSRTQLKQLSTAHVRMSALLDYAPTLMTSFNYHLSKGPVSNYSHIEN